ncbi:MAG: hypothetical protein WA162_00690 [Thermodesulfobacteriota bacterium]
MNAVKPRAYPSWIVIFITIVLISFPLRTILSSYFVYRANVSITNVDAEIGESSMKPIIPETILDYEAALRYLGFAKKITPGNSRIFKDSAELRARLGKWKEIVTALKGGEDYGNLVTDGEYPAAIEDIRKAIFLEPTNPEYHLALAKLYAGSPGGEASAKNELERAVKAYPVNAPLRQAVANQYLLAGMKGEAIAEARELARLDVIYLVPEYIKGSIYEEAWRSETISRIHGSYLFAAFELVWRASGDRDVISGIAPDNPEAKEVLDAFFEWRGLEQE